MYTVVDPDLDLVSLCVYFFADNEISLFKKFKHFCQQQDNSFCIKKTAPLSNHGYPGRLKQGFSIPIPPTEKKNYPTRKCDVCSKHKTRN